MAVAYRAAVVSWVEELSDHSILQEARSSEDEEFLFFSWKGRCKAMSALRIISNVLNNSPELGTLNAGDQWPIDVTLQNWLYFVFITEFVERSPTIFPVNIWGIYMFEIGHRWAKWLIFDPSPKGTPWINDPMIQLSVFRSRRPVIRWILFQSGFDR